MGTVRKARAEEDSSAHPRKAGSLPLAPLCLAGFAGAQSWMPIVGMISDAYRASSLSLESLAPLMLSYFLAFASAAFFFSLARVKGALADGTFGVLAGALFSCLGSMLLFLFEGLPFDRLSALLALVGLLLGLGGCLLLLPWTLVANALPRRIASLCAMGGVFLCCVLATFAQFAGATQVLLVLTGALSAVSAACYVASRARAAEGGEGSTTSGIRVGILRLAASFGCFGLIFSMMITQFVIAPHGRASALTWTFGFYGLAAAVAFLLLGRVARKRWDFLFAFRFAAVPVIVAFFPFDAGSDFSLKFALCVSTMALWCFVLLAPGVVWEGSRLLHAPLHQTAASGLCGLLAGAVAGYAVGWLSEWVSPSPNYLINITAIISMVLALIGSNIIVTRGSLARSRRSAASVPEALLDTGSLAESVAEVSLAYGLTKREADVIGILARGHGLSRVQEELFISEGTAITHRRHIYQKLDVHSKSELIDFVARFGADDREDD